MIVAKAARNRRASGEIVLHKGTHNVVLKALLLIDDVVGNGELLGNTACIIDIVKRAATSLHRFRHTLSSGKAALVPQLHRESYDVVPFGAQHGRNGRGVHTARHCYRDSLLAHNFTRPSLLRACTRD